MKLSKRRILACFLAVMLCMAAFSIPAYARAETIRNMRSPRRKTPILKCSPRRAT